MQTNFRPTNLLPRFSIRRIASAFFTVLLLLPGASGEAKTSGITGTYSPAFAAIFPLSANFPPLTDQMVREHAAFTEFLLGVRLTPAQRAEHRAFLVRYWNEGNEKEIGSVLGIIDLHRKLQKKEPLEREAHRLQMRDRVIPDLRRKADAGQEDAAFLLRLFDAAHPVIAPGNPPLTREMADAFTDANLWHYREILGIPLRQPTTGERAKARKELAESWDLLPEEQRQLIAGAPARLAYVRFGWREMSEKERAEVRRQHRADWERSLAQDTRTAQEWRRRGVAHMNDAAFFRLMMDGGKVWDEREGIWRWTPGVRTTID